VESNDRTIAMVGANLAPARTSSTQQHARDDLATLKAQIEGLKQVVAALRAQLADMHAQRDKWQSRAERISLTASY
jgi:cell division protein FtsB